MSPDSDARDEAAWLASYAEDPIDADIEICDPHHHLWHHPTKPYLLDDLRADTGSGHNVTSTVFVECMAEYRTDGPEELRPVGETDFVRAIAEESAAMEGATIAGIVSFADLTLGDAVADVLAAHDKAGGGLFRGIRHAVSWDASPDVGNAHTRPAENLLADPTFRDGLRALAAGGYGFDAWLYHPQLDELTAAARSVPELPIVLDHVGGPIGIGPYANRFDEIMESWRPAIARLAACENVSVKLGGIGMALYGLGWHKREAPPSSAELAEAWGPAIEHCIESFGPQRCMFESNFPVDKRSCSYTVLWNTFQRIAADASAAERAALFGGTAERFYRLGDGA